MFAGELKKQKTLFMVADADALLVVSATALWLHDPSHSMAGRPWQSSLSGDPVLQNLISQADQHQKLILK
jgi:hypothetical protein